MRSGCILCVAVALTFTGGARAEEAPAGTRDVIPGTFSATAAVTSDYVFRGISQSDESAAIQGGLDWKHGSGVFLGVWGSSVDFNDGDQASVELDWYGGYAGTFRDFSYDARVIYYSYPGADVPRDYDYWEAGLAVGYQPITNLALTLGYNYSPDFFAESGSGHYLYGEAKYSLGMLPVPVTVRLGAARQWIDDNAAFGTPDYWTWSAGLGVKVESIEFTVSYVDTDIDHDRCGAALDVCGERFVFGATYAL